MSKEYKSIDIVSNNDRKPVGKLSKLEVPKEKMDVAFPSMGLSSLNPYIGSDSAAREAMRIKQSNKTVSILKPDLRTVITGLEYEIGEYVEQFTLPADSTILAITPRYSGGQIISTTIKYEVGDEGIEDILTISDLGYEDSKFAYRYIMTDAFKNLKVGQRFKERTQLAVGISGYRGEFSHSVNAIMANVSHTECSKDAIVVSQSLLDSGRLDYLTVKNIKLALTKEVLYNLYGDEDNYIPLPTPGEPINPNGYIVGYFKPKSSTAITKARLLDQDACTMETLYELQASVEKATVKSVKVIKLCDAKKTHMTAQLEDYWEETRAYYEEMDTLPTDEGVKGNNYHNLLKEIYAVTTNKKVSFMDGDNNPDWFIEIELEILNRPTIKDKITTFHGAKGLISAILPDYLMPYDSRGQRAEIIIDSTAIERRMIPGNKFEGYLHDNANWNSKKFLTRLEAGDRTVKKDILEYLELWGNPTVVDVYKESSMKDILEVAKNTGIRPVINIYDGNDTHTAITTKIMNSKYATPLDGLWIPQPDGEDVHVQQPIATELISISIHYKNGESFQGSPNSYVNAIGGVVSPPKEVKSTKSYNISNIRMFSESETRMMTQQGLELIKFIKRIRIISNSPDAQLKLTRKILRKDMKNFYLTDEEEKEVLKGEIDTPNAILDGVLLTYGVRLNLKALKFSLRPKDCLE